jgi:MFS family permease
VAVGKGNEKSVPTVSLALTALATMNAAAASYIGSVVCAFAASLLAAVAIASAITWLRLGRAKASGAFALVAAVVLPLVGAYGGWLFSSYAAGRRDVEEMRPLKLRMRVVPVDESATASRPREGGLFALGGASALDRRP